MSHHDPSTPLNGDGDPVQPDDITPQRLDGDFLGIHRDHSGETPIAGKMGFAVDGNRARFDIRPVGPGEPAPPVITESRDVKKFLNDVESSTKWYAGRNRPIAPVPKPGKVATLEEVFDRGEDTVLCPLCLGEAWDPECYVCDGEKTVSRARAKRFRIEQI